MGCRHDPNIHVGCCFTHKKSNTQLILNRLYLSDINFILYDLDKHKQTFLFYLDIKQQSINIQAVVIKY